MQKVFLPPYDIKLGVCKEVQIKPKYRGVQEGIDKFLNIKRRITKTHHLREHFFEVRVDWGMYNSSNYFDYSMLGTDQELIT